MLGPASVGSNRLRKFVEVGGVSVWFLDRTCDAIDAGFD
jgi:hypothetical protein